MTYFEKLSAAKDRMVEALRARAMDARYVDFGGPGTASGKKPTIPTDARSEFLANRAMGDWAEDVLAGAIRHARADWKILKYGNAQRIAAGEPGFKEFYLNVSEEVRVYGKRPDLLIFPDNVDVLEDMSAVPLEEADKLVPRAIGGIEVRSSKFEAIRYISVRKQQKAEGRKIARDAPSFTVKLEDLKIVYRWIERYRVPQVYCQVFFDSAFSISVLEVFQLLGSGKGYSIERPAKSQEKVTIMIPITGGRKIGTFLSPPGFMTAEKVTELGRHDAYVVPTGGHLEIDAQELEASLLA